MEIKIIYDIQSIPTEMRGQYDLYTIIKTIPTKKPGFLSKKEIESTAPSLRLTKRNLIHKLNTLVSTGFIQKNKYGYTLTSTNTIHNNLNINKSTKIIKGKEVNYTPYIKYQLSVTTDTKVIEATRLYTLINQIYQRYAYVNGCNTSKKSKKESPENFSLSIDKIMIKGGYHSHMEVWRLINQLENVGLLKIKRGSAGVKVDGKVYGGIPNQYTLLPFKSAKWNDLYNPKRMSSKERWNKLVGNVTAEKPTSTTKKKKAVYTELELKFRELLSTGLQDLLVEDGVLSRNYKSFAGKARKVSRTQYSKLLSYCLSKPILKEVILSRFAKNQLLIGTADGVYIKSNTFVYDRFKHFVYDTVKLVDGGTGNYTGRLLRYQQDEYKKTKFAANLSLNPAATCII